MYSSTINWCDCTFNPWEGCTKVSPGCLHCYAKARDERHLIEPVNHWGPGAARRIMSDGYWRQPHSWNRKAAASGTRLRVFCASLADVFDVEAPKGQRERLWKLIKATSHLDWLLLTKRADNIERMLPRDWGDGYPNVWLGATCENRKHGLSRIELVRNIPAAVRFLSCEPLIEDLGDIDLLGIDWVIIGGESGSDARSFDAAWGESLIRQCQAQGVKTWMKQLGRRPVLSGNDLVILGESGKRDGHAGNLTRWPKSLSGLCTRELPTPRILEVA